MDLLKAQQAIEKIDVGLKKYINIMSKLHMVDVSTDVDFQTKYNGFYRIRRNNEFRKEYFSYMEAKKRGEVTFGEVLYRFYDKFGSIEASFSSKLIATINPNLPVWDEFVLQNLGLKKPPAWGKDRLEQTIDLYTKIYSWYLKYLTTEESRELLNLFNKKYPDVAITDIKKIDLILWQMR